MTIKTYFSWKAITPWKWEIGGVGDDETCGICYSPFNGCCTQCKHPGLACPIVSGICKHVFHKHCIENWISKDVSKGQCPMDRRPWVELDQD